MKTLGLMGGTSWLSTVDYYSHINRETQRRMGGLNSARLVLFSINLAPFATNTQSREYEANAVIVIDACQRLKAAGAEAIVLCANTLHMFADQVEVETGLPVVHIATATAASVRQSGLVRVALLGTRVTMEMDFFRSRLANAGVEALVPAGEDFEFVNDSIFGELGRGVFTEPTKRRYVEVISTMKERGVQGVVMACTEIPLLLKAVDVDIPLFDTTLIHSAAAVEFAFGTINGNGL